MRLIFVKIVKWIACAIVLVSGGLYLLTFLSVVPLFGGEARSVYHVNTIKEVSLSLEMYKLDHGVYPIRIDMASLASNMNKAMDSNGVSWKYGISCEYHILSTNKYSITSIMPKSLFVPRIKRTHVYSDGELEESVIE